MNRNTLTLAMALSGLAALASPVLLRDMNAIDLPCPSLRGRPMRAKRLLGRRLSPTPDELRHRTERRPEFRLRGCFRRRLISRAGLRLAAAS